MNPVALSLQRVWAFPSLASSAIPSESKCYASSSFKNSSASVYSMDAWSVWPTRDFCLFCLFQTSTSCCWNMQQQHPSLTLSINTHTLMTINLYFQERPSLWNTNNMVKLNRNKKTKTFKSNWNTFERHKNNQERSNVIFKHRKNTFQTITVINISVWSTTFHNVHLIIFINKLDAKRFCSINIALSSLEQCKRKLAFKMSLINVLCKPEIVFVLFPSGIV